MRNINEKTDLVEKVGSSGNGTGFNSDADNIVLQKHPGVNTLDAEIKYRIKQAKQRKPKEQYANRVIICEELVKLTGNMDNAAILSQLVYWEEHRSSKDFADMVKYLIEEKFRDAGCGVPIEHGWIYKTASDLSKETFIGLTDPIIREKTEKLVTGGWLAKRRNPKGNWDRTWQYRVDLVKIRHDLIKLGYTPDKYVNLNSELYFEYLTNYLYAHVSSSQIKEWEDEMLANM